MGERRWSWGQPRHQGQTERTKGKSGCGGPEDGGGVDYDPKVTLIRGG